MCFRTKSELCLLFSILYSLLCEVALSGSKLHRRENNFIILQKIVPSAISNQSLIPDTTSIFFHHNTEMFGLKSLQSERRKQLTSTQCLRELKWKKKGSFSLNIIMGLVSFWKTHFNINCPFPGKRIWNEEILTVLCGRQCLVFKCFWLDWLLASNHWNTSRIGTRATERQVFYVSPT